MRKASEGKHFIRVPKYMIILVERVSTSDVNREGRKLPQQPIEHIKYQQKAPLTLALHSLSHKAPITILQNATDHLSKPALKVLPPHPLNPIQLKSPHLESHSIPARNNEAFLQD
jgi:hypothetical protein